MATQTAPVKGARPAKARSTALSSNLGNRIAHGLTFAASVLVVVITVMLVFQLWANSAESRAKFGLSFLTTSVWDNNHLNFGALPFIFGTVVTSGLALLIAVPLGVGTAVFLAELALPKLSDALTFMIELLAAVPSVIFGLLGIFVLQPILVKYVVPAIKALPGVGQLPIFAGSFYGPSIFTASVVLAIMVLPFIVSVSREVLLAVPREQREAALALGATKWETTYQIVLPYASTGIIGSVFLALARALGETMAVTMVVGNEPSIHTSLFKLGSSIAAVIANQFSESSGMQQSALIELGLVLFALTFVINGTARLLVAATTREGSRKK